MNINFEPLISVQNLVNDQMLNRAQRSSYFSQQGLEGKTLDEILTWARETKKWYETGQPNDGIYRYAQGLLGGLASLQSEQRRLLQEIESQAKRRYPEIPSRANSQETAAIASVLECDQWQDNPQAGSVAESVFKSVARAKKINLLAFTCPEVDFQYLRGPDPSYFIQTSAGKNSFDLQWQRNRQLFRVCSASGFPVQLDIIVGELDEESYIFPVLGDFGVSQGVLSQRRADYRYNLAKKLKSRYQGIDIRVTGWSEIAPARPLSFPRLPSFDFISQEMNRMRSLMRPGRYYDGVLNPNNTEMAQICKLKMETYATQGLVLKELFPYSVGLQNEAPARLRTLMINSGLIQTNSDDIAYIYPYKIEL